MIASRFESGLLHKSNLLNMTKYNNKKYKGYDSIREYNRSNVLKLMQKQGLISDLQEQIKYELVPVQYELIGGKRKVAEHAVKYIADFQYIQNGDTIVEDVKGMRTKEYIIKRKLMRHVHGITIKEV